MVSGEYGGAFFHTRLGGHGLHPMDSKSISAVTPGRHVGWGGCGRKVKEQAFLWCCESKQERHAALFKLDTEEP